MSVSYKAVYKSLLSNTFTEEHFFADSDETAREKARSMAKFPLLLNAIACFVEGNRTRDVGLDAKSSLHQIQIKDDYKKD